MKKSLFRFRLKAFLLFGILLPPICYVAFDYWSFVRFKSQNEETANEIEEFSYDGKIIADALRNATRKSVRTPQIADATIVSEGRTIAIEWISDSVSVDSIIFTMSDGSTRIVDLDQTYTSKEGAYYFHTVFPSNKVPGFNETSLTITNVSLGRSSKPISKTVNLREREITPPWYR